MTNVLPTPDFSKFFRTNINLGPVNSFYNSFNTKKANLYKILGYEFHARLSIGFNDKNRRIGGKANGSLRMLCAGSCQTF